METKSDKNYLREIVISLILVTQNHGKAISEVIKKINSMLSTVYPNYEIIIIDNNSEDDILENLMDSFKRGSHIRIIRLSKVYPIDVVYTAGLENCIGDFVVMIDIPLVPIKTIFLALNKLIEGYDLVSAKPSEGNFKRWSISNIFLSTLKWISNQKFDYQRIYLLAVNRKVVNTITRIKRKSRNFLYLNNPLGFSKVTLNFQTNRIDNKEYRAPNFLELLLIVIDLIISNSFKPIRLFSFVGIIIGMLSLCSMTIVITWLVLFDIYLIEREWLFIYTFASLVLFTLFSLLGLISEYLIRVLDETRNEPIYYIDEEIDKTSFAYNRKKRLNVIQF